MACRLFDSRFSSTCSSSTRSPRTGGSAGGMRTSARAWRWRISPCSSASALATSALTAQSSVPTVRWRTKPRMRRTISALRWACAMVSSRLLTSSCWLPCSAKALAALAKLLSAISGWLSSWASVEAISPRLARRCACCSCSSFWRWRSSARFCSVMSTTELIQPLCAPSASISGAV
jgi:hypothetical protein